VLKRVSFSVEGEAQIERAFNLEAHMAADMSEPLSRMADVILERVNEQFATEGAHGEAGGWRPLSPEYAKWKAKHYPGAPILVRTGKMKDLLLDKSSSVTVTKQSMIYAPLSEYAGYHQRGTVKMPARKPVNLTMADRKAALNSVFTVWVNEMRRKAFG
jgi:phage gpG-like protein